MSPHLNPDCSLIPAIQMYWKAAKAVAMSTTILTKDPAGPTSATSARRRPHAEPPTLRHPHLSISRTIRDYWIMQFRLIWTVLLKMTDFQIWLITLHNQTLKMTHAVSMEQRRKISTSSAWECPSSQMRHWPCMPKKVKMTMVTLAPESIRKDVNLRKSTFSKVDSNI